MKIINQSAEVLNPHGYDLDSIYKDIERAARTSYKSEDKITEDGAKPFVERLIKNGHLSCLEHGTVYLHVPDLKQRSDYSSIAESYSQNPYSRVRTVINSAYDYITTNMRVIVENGWESDLQYLCAPYNQHEKRVSVRFITSIAMSRELNRHRHNSIIEQSTRYCNYSKNKFGGEIKFIKSPWFKDEGSSAAIFFQLEEAEKAYFKLLEEGKKPQEARDALPLCTATELIHTAFINDWYHLFDLRCSPSAHPQMQMLIKPLKGIFDNMPDTYKYGIPKDELLQSK